MLRFANLRTGMVTGPPCSTKVAAVPHPQTEVAMTLVERASVCTLDCPDTCSLTVTVEDDRIVKVRGSDALPYTDGVICNKVAHQSGEFVHGAGRLLHPLQRVGPRGSGQFRRIGWADALDQIHRRVAA